MDPERHLPQNMPTTVKPMAHLPADFIKAPVVETPTPPRTPTPTPSEAIEKKKRPYKKKEPLEVVIPAAKLQDLIKPFRRDGLHGLPPELASLPDKSFDRIDRFTYRFTRQPAPMLFDQEEFEAIATAKEQLPGTTKKLSASDIVHMAFFEEELTLRDLLPYRVHAAWRITRELGRLKGNLHMDTRIREGLQTRGTYDPWVDPEPFQPHHHSHGNRPPSTTLLELMMAANDADESDQVSRYNTITNTEVTYPGLALTPPPVPRKFWKITPDIGLDILPGYDPEADVMLGHFISICREVARELNTYAPGEDVNSGRYGMMGLLHPQTIRIAWPSKEEIEAWEQILLLQTAHLLPGMSVGQARSTMMHKYALREYEATMLVALAKIEIHESMTNDVELDKSLMVYRLEEFLQRCRNAFDLRAEIMGLKQLAIVQGITRMEGDTDKGDIIATIKRIATEKSQPAFIEGSARALGDGQ